MKRIQAFYFLVLVLAMLSIPSGIAAQFGISQTFSSTNNLNPAITPLVGDVDFDGQTEIVALNNSLNIIYVHDGATGAIENSFGVVHMGSDCSCNQPGGNISMGDVNANGNVEVLMVGNDQFLYCYQISTGSLLWTSSDTVSDNEDGPFIADFNQDGNPEVYAGNQIFNGATGVQLVQAPNGALDPMGRVACGVCLSVAYGVWGPAYPIAVDALPDAACADCQGLELVTGNTIFAVSAGFTTMTPVVSIAGLGYSDGPVSVGDIDGDGDLDLVSTVMMGTTWGVVGWDLQTTTILGFFPFSQNTWGGRANLADLDCDPGLEITVVSDDIIYFINDDFTLLNTFVVRESSRSTSVSAFDFDADGIEEIVYRGETNLHILEGSTGSSLATIACGSPTATEFPVVADVDNNGDAEIVTICGNSNTYNLGRLGIYDSNGAPWAPARAVMNQHGYYNVNVNDDLSIPAVQLAHHTIPGLNGFMNQAASLNPGVPLYPASDAAITIDSLVLGASGFTATVTVCNTNLAGQALPAATPIAFFDDDPTMVAATTLLSGATTTALAPGQCETLTFSFAGPCSSIYAIVNENGDGNPALPFDLLVDFQFATSGECDFTNNVDVNNLSCTPLDASGITLDAERVDGQIRLLWEVSDNANREYFEVRKSLDGASFETIQLVESSHNEQLATYSLLDFEIPEEVLYYQLKVINRDGSVHFSNISMVRDLQPSILAFPNPTSGIVNLSGIKDVNQIEIYDLEGRRVFLSEGRSKIDISHLSEGTYEMIFRTQSGKILDGIRLLRSLPNQ